MTTGIYSTHASHQIYYNLSKSLPKINADIAATFSDIQIQMNSLAPMVLQNCQALDVFTARSGGTYSLLGEECFGVNQNIQVQHIKTFLEGSLGGSFS